MFGFFKRKERVKQMSDWEHALLRQVVVSLPDKYSFLRDQINTKFIVDSVPNEILKNGWKRMILDQELYLKRKMDSSINYQIQGVRVFEDDAEEFREVKLDVYEGVLVGYRIDGSQFDLTKIDITGLLEYRYPDSVNDLKYILNFNEKKSKKLNLKDSVEIEVSGKGYYIVKDFQDGNYLSIDEGGKVYGMFHDPYLIEVIDDNAANFIDKVNAGGFSIERYYDSKFSLCPVFDKYNRFNSRS